MKLSSSSSSSSLLARAVAILLVIACCCSLLPCPCSANDKLGQDSDGGEGAGNHEGWWPPSPWHNGGYGTSYQPYEHEGEGAGTREGSGPPPPLHNVRYGASYPPYGHGGAALAPAPSTAAHRKDLQVSRS